MKIKLEVKRYAKIQGTMNNALKHIALVLFLISDLNTKAQLWYNKAEVFHSDPGIQMRVEGSFMNDSSAFSENNGKIVIDSSFFNVTASTQKGSGECDVYGNWINSAHFLHDTSFVHLKGLTEYIEGDSATGFYNLAIEGGERKIMKVNASIWNYLYLNSFELATNEDTLFIKNASAAAINASLAFGSEGFVSTLDTGCLVRATNSEDTYYFPMGSIIGSPRFRPIQLSPNVNSINTYAVSFQNKKEDFDGYFVADKDSNVCKVNPLFFHTINRISGNSGTDITIGYLKTSDGLWTEIGNWDPPYSKWKNTNNGAASGINSYNGVKRSGWNTFSSKPYALENFTPLIDSISGANLLCKLSETIFTGYTDELSAYLFIWSSTGSTFVGDTMGSNINILFAGSGVKQIHLTIIDTATGCISNSLSKLLSVSAGPKAGFSISYPNLFLNTPISFLDSSKGASLWSWNFGNGISSSLQDPQTAYGTQGNYIIKQIVIDSIGCRDSSEISLDIACSVKVPNVFSPNGDGVNDVFLIQGMCITDYTLEIVDRWGLMVYRGAYGSAAWDGRSPSGEICPAGTYFYILQIEGNKKENGFITLIR